MERLLAGYLQKMVKIRLPCKSPLLAVMLLLSSALCHAIDNPEAADLSDEFQSRADAFELDIRQQAQNQTEIVLAYSRYTDFLDRELNQAYSTLSTQLADGEKTALTASQRLWLQFRDAEFAFIDANWSLQHFGSSSAISRSAYRASITRHRVIELLDYAKNYRQKNH
jgi:uncharacterized protein YecT (DUF1311 family)